MLLCLSILVSCSKRDIRPLRDVLKLPCTPSSLNADKQDKNEFWVIKTYNEFGTVTHLKTQLRDVYGNSHIYDYEINYGIDKARLVGSKRVYEWIYDGPPVEDGEQVDPNAPWHPQEMLDQRDDRSIEVLFSHRTRNPVEVRYAENHESLLKLTYDTKGFLKTVGQFLVTTDTRGNILTIYTPPYEGEYYHGQILGLSYSYSEDSTRRPRSYYETPNIFISPMFSLLELLDWGSLQPDRERTGFYLMHDFGDEAYPVQPTFGADYLNHTYDADGKLIAYTFVGDFKQPYPYPLGGDYRHVQRTIQWRCNAVTNEIK